MRPEGPAFNSRVREGAVPRVKIRRGPKDRHFCAKNLFWLYGSGTNGNQVPALRASGTNCSNTTTPLRTLLLNAGPSGLRAVLSFGSLNSSVQYCFAEFQVLKFFRSTV
jgi:hypothetical protein